MGGDYEDHVSGLPEFTLYGMFILWISAIGLTLDLSVWWLRHLVGIVERTRRWLGI
jgi:hypothetical protein